MKYPNTSKRINKALNDKSMSAQKLSNITGIAKSSISGYVNGVHKIGADKAAKIGKVLNVSPLWLMELDENGSHEEDMIILYSKYMSVSEKTKHIIDLLLEEGD